jgi:ornithine cyclodeaminase/alanine dehydrogenase-like protein (mu-crystallin family)
MSLLILDHQAVGQALPMYECIEVMATALVDLARGAYHPFPRRALRCPSTPALMGLMPVFKDGEAPLWGLKDVLVSASNRALGLDSHQGAMLVHDGRTGALQAVLDAGALTAIRTAATTAVATRTLARSNATQVAILGTGAQARTHIAALRLVLPEAKFRLWGRSFERAQVLASSTQAAACEHAQDAVAEADVVCTLTAATTPLLQRDWLRPGCHVNAVGASSRDARELGSDVVAAAELFVDSLEQAQEECGEVHLALVEGAIAADHIRGELGQVLSGACAGRTDDKALTVFKSLGLAVEDLAAAERAMRNAERMGIGQRVRW